MNGCLCRRGSPQKGRQRKTGEVGDSGPDLWEGEKGRSPAIVVRNKAWAQLSRPATSAPPFFFFGSSVLSIGDHGIFIEA